MPARAVIALTFLAVMLAASGVPALDQAGKDAGNQMGAYARDRLGSKSGLEQRSKLPMTDPAAPLRTFDDGSQQPAAMFCGQGGVRSEQAAVSITVSSTQVAVQSDTNGDGLLDSSSTNMLTRVCREGYEFGASYYRWTVDGAGSIGVAGSASLDGCVDPQTAPPTYAGGKIAELYASATGRTITRSATSGATTTYYSGRVSDCLNQPKNISQTKYYDNPYAIRDAGIAAQFSSCPPNDEYCMGYRQAVPGLNAGHRNFSSSPGTGVAVCDITRSIIDSTGPHNGVVCEADRLYYSSGHSDTNRYCMTNPSARWDYTSMFRIRCDPYGRSLTLEGWATWEGAPCGTGNTANFPPEPQVTRPLSYGGTSVDRIVGRLSVNRRVGGDNIAYNDLDASGTQCYSQQFPLNVHLSHGCAPSNESCTYAVRVDNAPGCGSFTIPVAPPVGETIANGCEFYESGSCKLLEEQWFDANNTGVATMRNGAATHDTLPETCRTFPAAGTVCKPWWRKQRTYSCAAGYDTARNKEPSTSRAMTVVFSADNMNSASVGYARSSFNLEHTPTCLVEITRSMPCAEGTCTMVSTREAQCIYNNPAMKTGLRCDSSNILVESGETRRIIVRDCIEMEQCRISCVVRVPDVNAPSGYVSETRACAEQGNNVYACPSGGYAVEKDCGCIVDTWDPAITKGEDCEVGCIVTNPTARTFDSNVRTDYAVKSCIRADVNGTPTYTCPLGAGETMTKDCACVDTFGMAAGVLGALEQAVKDRECE